jgi:hypothetical protein
MGLDALLLLAIGGAFVLLAKARAVVRFTATTKALPEVPNAPEPR